LFANDPESVERAFSELDGLANDLDVLINNAGISIRNSNRVAA
jgi:NAD(P)-dependent dehydrogenase (short-subunit alcohol dehydrogenase family)